MRTTVTLDPDAAALVAKAMRERGLTFKQVVNEAIRAGLGGAEASGGLRVAARPMGTPVVPLTKALALAAELEDEEIVRKLVTRR